MTTTSHSTAAVTVTITPLWLPLVFPHGAATYPNQLNKARVQQITTATSYPNVHVSESKAGDVAQLECAAVYPRWECGGVGGNRSTVVQL
jgi:hypothetical protein